MPTDFLRAARERFANMTPTERRRESYATVGGLGARRESRDVQLYASANDEDRYSALSPDAFRPTPSPREQHEEAVKDRVIEDAHAICIVETEWDERNKSYKSKSTLKSKPLVQERNHG